ncbi:MAG: hypothetical protein NTV97_06410 [Alphaproteobacteria bacterium]|nr:hypothetical protein [Alphaproteobacteria bacterium]
MKDILVGEFKVVAKGLLHGVVALFAIAMIFYFVLGLAFGMISVPPLSAMVGTLVWVVCIVLALGAVAYVHRVVAALRKRASPS